MRRFIWVYTVCKKKSILVYSIEKIKYGDTHERQVANTTKNIE